MPSFSQEQHQAWHDERIARARRARQPSERQWADLTEAAAAVEARVEALKDSLAIARTDLASLKRKLARRGLR